MKIKTTLKKLKRGDVVSIDWIDAGDLDDSPSSWFSEADAEKVFKEIPVETIAIYFGHEKENLFLMRDVERQDISDLCTSKTGKSEETGRVFGHYLDTNCDSEN